MEFLLPFLIGRKDEFEQAINIINELCELVIPPNLRNSNVSPSQEQNRKRVKREKSKDKMPGGQEGHEGTTKQAENPDQIEKIKLDTTQLPGFGNGVWKYVGTENRQVHSVVIKPHVTEYQAEVYVNIKNGQRVVAEFLDGVNAPVVFSPLIKAFAVYGPKSNLAFDINYK
jgi:hypothetical protein